MKGAPRWLRATRVIEGGAVAGIIASLVVLIVTSIDERLEAIEKKIRYMDNQILFLEHLVDVDNEED